MNKGPHRLFTRGRHLHDGALLHCITGVDHNVVTIMQTVQNFECRAIVSTWLHLLEMNDSCTGQHSLIHSGRDGFLQLRLAQRL